MITKKSKNEIRLGTRNILSRIGFIWVFRLIVLVKKTANDFNNLDLTLRGAETSKQNDTLLDKKWREEIDRAAKQNRKPLIRKAIIRAYGLRFALNGLWKILWGIALWFEAYWLLKKIVQFARIQSTDKWLGHQYALGFLASSVIASVGIHQLLSQSGCLGLRVKSALMVQIFRKSLVLARIKGGAGDIVNLVSNDCTKVADAFTNCHYLWSALLELTAIFTLAFIELGLSALPALGIVLIVIPIQIAMGWLKSKLCFKKTMTTSKRVHVMSEILTAIKLIKFYAWEKPFFDRVCEIRKTELSLLKQDMLMTVVNFTIVITTPVSCSLLTFLTLWQRGYELNPVIGFTIISVLNTLRYPLIMLPLAVNSASDILSALRRLDEFFAYDEIQPMIRYPVSTDTKESIILENATFKWDVKSDDSSSFALTDLTFSVKRGQLTAVVGDVGSGKSSLLAALLGQMIRIDGESRVLGSIGYVPQEAWLLNMSLRDNIIFGSPYDEARYRKVIKVCALERDLSLMISGDQTEIGERGINLSGGQRQRVSLARCVYKMNDVVLLDDPLSAVDQKVGNHIFTQCIRKHFREKTVLFVTHQLQYLHQVDDIIVIQNGRISEHGSFNELMSRRGDLARLVGEHVQIINPPAYEAEVTSPKHVSEPQSLTPQQLHNRRRLSTTGDISDSEISAHIEAKIQNELLCVNGQNSNNLIKALETNRMSIVSESDEPNEEDVAVVPDDAEPMKLVLDDQSVFYKKSAFAVYLQAGWGSTLTSVIVFFFYIVYLARIGGGRKFDDNNHLKNENE